MNSASEGNEYYLYDGDGNRVKKVWVPPSGPTKTSYYFYNALGQMAVEYSSDLVASASVTYPFTDMLGSTRAVTNQSGAVTECYDYLPFGRMLSSSDNGRGGCHPPAPDISVSSSMPQKFTGKERDETGLDYFLARYYSGALGRFTSTDPIIMGPHKVSNPQNMNLYNYAINNPLRFTDPTGEKIVENVPNRYQDDYVKWRNEFISNSFGWWQWFYFWYSPNYIINITIGESSAGDGGGQFIPAWGENGNLIGGTIILSPKLDEGSAKFGNYPASSQLKTSGYFSRNALAASKIAHEWGHLLYYIYGGITQSIYDDTLQAADEWNDAFRDNGNLDPNRPDLIDRMGGMKPPKLEMIKEFGAEAYGTVQWLRSKYSHGGMPNTVKDALKSYNEAMNKIK